MIKLRPRRPSVTPGAPGSSTSGRKGSELGAEIGRELRALFDSVVAEPVPDAFRQLLDELERKSGKR